MQGLPVQNLVKTPIKGDAKPSAHAVSVKGDKSSTNPKVGSQVANVENADVANTSGKVAVDFASLFEGAKTAKGEEVAKEGMESLKNAKGEILQKHGEKKSADGKSDAKSIETSIARSSSSLDQLLNNLKSTNDSDVESTNEKELNPLKKNFFPNQKGEGAEIKKDSPLDFLVKGARENKVSENAENSLEKVLGKNESEIQNLTAKKELANSAKIPNNVSMKMMETDSKLNARENLKLVSGEEFVNAKAQTLDSKSFDPKKLGIDKNGNNSAELLDLTKVKAKDISQIKGYYQGQNILNDSMIKNTKDLAFKEQKKGKLSSIDELLSPDMKTSNDLSMIKEAPIPMLAAKIGDNGVNLKNAEATKVLDLSNIHTADTNKLIDKISDYVMQSNMAGKDQIDLTVKHEELGQFQIQVTKNPTAHQPNQIDMQIMTSNTEGHKFFVENEGALMKSLQQSGMNLSDLRIVSSMTEVTPNSFSESKQFNSFNQNQNGSYSSQNFESFQSGDYRQGSEKRKDLWNEYRERYGA